MVKVSATGRANPSHVKMNINQWVVIEHFDHHFFHLIYVFRKRLDILQMRLLTFSDVIFYDIEKDILHLFAVSVVAPSFVLLIDGTVIGVSFLPHN